MQLLALMIEVISIQVAGKQIKKPIDIPRPGKGKTKAERRGTRPETPSQPEGTPGPDRNPAAPRQTGDRDAAFKKGIAVLQSTTRSRR